MNRFVSKILAPVVAAVAAIMVIVDLISALNRIKTGLEAVIFVANTTSSAIQTYNNFTVWRDDFYDQIFSTIFYYMPFLHDVPEVIWNILRIAIFLYIMFLCIDLYQRS